VGEQTTVKTISGEAGEPDGAVPVTIECAEPGAFTTEESEANGFRSLSSGNPVGEIPESVNEAYRRLVLDAPSLLPRCDMPVARMLFEERRAEQIARFKPAPSIRSATESDIADLLGLIGGLAAYEGLRMTATAEGLQKMLFGPHPAVEALLAFCGSECAGYATFYGTYCTMLARPAMYLDNIFAKPDFRGTGIGNALFRRLAEIAAERKWAGGGLRWRCLDWNQSAIRFYVRVGATPKKGWTLYELSDEAIQKLAAE
jgi:GNAT superfamily N-acetyltransferase